ncbi:hypothetical protein SAMN04487905_11471 [Actinopolyspora xinjiangensis]|uniref:Peptidase inhibitor family I36 n=1 Tax=Actinopolyspora xinjiangensis TaxID=405564 RepID=A0A1H0WRE9_9ACTN|nr:hypothetical protein [Actinopolyspora xinjiangensis]SDP93280.1 hypothetical protein SAMN04487905_11471 [Actinopolyspora xinjiangensis]
MATTETGSGPLRTRSAAVALAGLAVAAGLTATTAGAAQASDSEEHCVLDVSSREYTCHGTPADARQRGQRIADTTGEVIGATVFEDVDYGGSSLTITVPEPCPKNDNVDFWLDLDDHWQNRISSVQTWSTCWVWLYPDSGDRAGPYKENHPDVGDHINDRTVTVGLS